MTAFALKNSLLAAFLIEIFAALTSVTEDEREVDSTSAIYFQCPVLSLSNEDKGGVKNFHGGELGFVRLKLVRTFNLFLPLFRSRRLVAALELFCVNPKLSPMVPSIPSSIKERTCSRFPR